MVVFLILYVDDTLLIGNDVGTLSSVKVWLSNQFDMKVLGEAGHILGIKVIRDSRKEYWAYPKLPISIKFLLGSACKILRKDLFLSKLESLYQVISVLRFTLR